MKFKLLLGVIALAGLLASCVTDAPSLEVFPQNPTVEAGGNSVQFSANLKNSSATVQWSLAGVGSLDQTTGATVHYTPPGAQQMTQASTAVLTATAGSVSQSTLISIAVGSPRGPDPNQPTGTLALHISGPATAAFSPSVKITGPDGYSQTIANFGNQNLTVPVGSVTVSVNAVAIAGSVVDTVYPGYLSEPGAPTVNTYTVAQGAITSVYVGYQGAGFSGQVWLSFDSNKVFGFKDTQLSGASGTLSGKTVGNGTFLNGLAFDKKGNLWVADDQGAASTIKKYNPNGILELTILSNSGSLFSPRGIAFDKNGNLWVANLSNSKIVQYDAATLATATGSNSLAIVRSINTVPGAQWEQIAFDKNGNLWAADFGTKKVYQFAAGGLESNAAPAVTLGGLTNPYGVAIDSSGNLWVSDRDKGVMKFAPAPSTNGSPVPALTIKGPLVNSNAAAFDKNGDLWIADDIGLRQYTAAQINGQSGVYGSAPNKTFNVGGFARSVVFYPAPVGVPIIQTQRVYQSLQ